MIEKRILYLSYDGMTDPLGQSQVLPYLKGLAKEGYSIHLVSYEKKDKFLKHRKHIHSICDEANITWHPQDYVLGGSIFTTLKQIRRMVKIAFYLHSKYHFGIVHCRSYIAAIAGLKLKRKKGVKFIFDMRGFWADERVDGKLWDLNNRKYKTIYTYFKRKEIQFFKEADYAISLTENGKNEIRSWKALQSNPPKIIVIPCCVDLDLFDPNSISKEKQSIRRKDLQIETSDYLLGYVGSIGTWYMLSEMLDYFSVLHAENNKAKFLFITGESPDSILAMARDKNIDENLIIITSVLHDQVPLHISLFDQSIFFIRPSYSKKASSPTKQGEIMAMGIPLICNAGVGDTDEIVTKYQAGNVITEFNEKHYLDSIKNDQSFDKLSTMNGAAEYFSLEEGVQRYLSVYKSVYA